MKDGLKRRFAAAEKLAAANFGLVKTPTVHGVCRSADNTFKTVRPGVNAGPNINPVSCPLAPAHLRLPSPDLRPSSPNPLMPVDPINFPSTWCTAALALAIAAISLRGFFQLRGTTLAAPALWAVAVALAFASVETLLAAHPEWEGTLGASLARYAAAAGAFCPFMAVLGASAPKTAAGNGWSSRSGSS